MHEPQFIGKNTDGWLTNLKQGTRVNKMEDELNIHIKLPILCNIRPLLQIKMWVVNQHVLHFLHYASHLHIS